MKPHLSHFRPYLRHTTLWMRPYLGGEDLTGITVNNSDVVLHHSPKHGDMIYRLDNGVVGALALMSKEEFSKNYEPFECEPTQHDWSDTEHRVIEGGNGIEQYCRICGLGALAHTLRSAP